MIAVGGEVEDTDETVLVCSRQERKRRMDGKGVDLRVVRTIYGMRKDPSVKHRSERELNWAYRSFRPLPVASWRYQSRDRRA